MLIIQVVLIFFFRGVVQLFNAVRKHQADMEDQLEDAKTESKKERLYKNIDKKKFLQMLSGDKTKEDVSEVSLDLCMATVWKPLDRSEKWFTDITTTRHFHCSFKNAL